MKKLYTMFILIIICFACSNTNNNSNNNIVSNDSIQKTTNINDNSTEFLKLFKDIKPNNLHIYTIERNSNGDIIQNSFEGSKIDVKKFPYFNVDNHSQELETYLNGDNHIYAINKIDINEKYIGLILRDRSQYDETLIKLMLWDKKEKKIFDGIELADMFGDEGWYFDKESWITEYIYDKKFTIITRQKDCNPEDEELTKFSYTDSLKINTLIGDKFKTINVKKIDTIKYKLKLWKYYNEQQQD